MANKKLSSGQLPVKIECRIKQAMAGKTTMPYHDLMRMVFPPDKYPKAYNYSVNGGPPGCAMAFGAAIKRLGGRDIGQGCSRIVEIPKHVED